MDVYEIDTQGAYATFEEKRKESMIECMGENLCCPNKFR